MGVVCIKGKVNGKARLTMIAAIYKDFPVS